MGRLVLAIVIALWGAGIRGLLGAGLDGSGAHGGDQMAAFLFGFVMVGAGLRHLVRHFGRA